MRCVILISSHSDKENAAAHPGGAASRDGDLIDSDVRERSLLANRFLQAAMRSSIV